MSQEETLKKYSQFLADFCHGCLRTITAPADQFKLVLPLESIPLGKALLQDLNQSTLHSFLYSLVTVKQELLEESKWNSPLEAFAAAFCLRSYQCFRHAKDITPYLAKLKYAVKCIFFKQAMDQVEDGPEKRFSIVAEQICAKHMNLTKLNCFSMLSELDNYTSVAAYGTPSHASISWNEDMTSVTYHDQTLDLSQLRIGLQNACTRMEELLEELYMGHGIQVDIPKDLVDDMSNDEFGYSYVNKIISVPPNHLLKAIVEDKQTQMAYVDKDDQTKINPAIAHGWMVKAAELNSHLSFLLHLTSGQVARGTEVTGTRISNREMPRNFMMVHGKLMYIINYSKTSNLSNSETYLPYQLCQRLQTSMHQYLILIRPMESLLAQQLHGNEVYSLYQEFFIVQHKSKLDSTAFSALLSRYTERYFKVSLKLLAIRHIWIAIKREYIPALYWNHQKGNEIGDLLAGHSTATANRVYAVQSSQHTTTSMLILCAQFSRRWHDLIGLGQNPPPVALLLQQNPGHVSHMFTTEQPFEDVRRAPASNAPSAPPATSAIDVNALLQAMQMQMNQQQEKLMLQMQQMEKRMEATLIKAVAIGLQQYTPAPPMPQDLDTPPFSPYPLSLPPIQEEELQENQVRSAAPASAKSMLQAMALVYDKPDIQWKSNGQKELVCFTLTQNDNVLGVIPTGGGKSAVFEVIANILGQDSKKEVTMVICPYKALLLQFYLQNKARTQCAIWDGSSNSSLECHSASLVFVSADKVKRDDFFQCVLLLYFASYI